MKKIEVKLPELINSKDGDVLINKNGEWVATSYDEINKTNDLRLTALEGLRNEFKMLADNNKHFTIYAKSHFMVVYNLFKTKILLGEIECEDELLMSLDEQVLNGSISVEEAITKHPYLEKTFTSIYLDEKELKTFPQV